MFEKAFSIYFIHNLVLKWRGSCILTEWHCKSFKSIFNMAELPVKQAENECNF